MVKEYIQSNQQRFLDELFELLRIPSVSADSKHKNDVRKAAEYVVKKQKMPVRIRPKFVKQLATQLYLVKK